MIRIKKSIFKTSVVGLALMIFFTTVMFSGCKSSGVSSTDPSPSDNGEGLEELPKGPEIKNSEFLNKNISWPENKLLPSFSKPNDNLDYIDATRLAVDAQLMVSSLKGIVNSEKPRIYSYDGSEMKNSLWLDDLGYTYTKIDNAYELVKKYQSEIKGVVIYDPKVPDTINLATTIAGIEKALVVRDKTIEKLADAGVNLNVVADLRNKFKTSQEIYNYLYDNYWNKVSHRVIVGLDPNITLHLREYAVAINAAVVWLDTANNDDAELLKKFLVDMPDAKALYMGWWKDEGAGVKFASRYGVSTIASDFVTGLTVFGGGDRNIKLQEVPPKPELKNKVYVAVIMSDGDNMQFMQNKMKVLWKSKSRGSIPITWTIAPTIADAAPEIMSWYHATATPGDSFIAGPSGLAYNYVGVWEDKNRLKEFMRLTDEYCTKTGASLATMWDGNDFRGNESFSDEIIDIIAGNLKKMIGVTQQIQAPDILKNDVLITSLDVPYTYDNKLDRFEEAIQKGYNNLVMNKRQAPEFVAVQANPWHHTIDNLKKLNDFVQNLSSDDIEFVRLDHFCMLLRESMGASPLRK